jgi:elongator complex protein 4
VLTTSTGTPSLDELLGLGAGLALGNVLAIEEDGSTDYAGILLSCFASQGILGGQDVFVGTPEGAWPRGSLPGLVKSREKTKKEVDVGDKMKIAWRYERLGVVGEKDRGMLLMCRRDELIGIGAASNEQSPFSHPLDLTTSLPNPKLRYLPPTPKSSFPDLNPLITHLTANPHSITRLILPSVLSPLYYPPSSSHEPGPPLRFFATLRHLAQKFQTLVVALSWPIALFPQYHVLTQGLERFVDGVISLEVFPHGFSTYDEDIALTDETTDRDKMEMQGLIRVKKLPVLSDRGMGLSRAADGGDWAFAMGRRKMVVRPFNLPPLGDLEEEKTASIKKDPLEF